MNIRPSNYRRWLYATAVRVHDQEFWIKYISNAAVNVNWETKALNDMCKIAFVKLSAYFYLYREAIAGCDSFKSDHFFRMKSYGFIAFGYALHEHWRMK